MYKKQYLTKLFSEHVESEFYRFKRGNIEVLVSKHLSLN